MEPQRKPRARPANRGADLARIHILTKECELSREDHEQLVHTFTNGRTTSSGDMDHVQRAAYIAHLDVLKRALGKGGPLPQWKKLRALWAALAAKQLVSANTEQAMNAWSQRQLGEGTKASARWCDNAELERLIEAAKAWLARAPKSPLPRAGEG